MGGDPFSDWFGGSGTTTPTSALPGPTGTTPATAGQPTGPNTSSYLSILQNDPILRQTLADLSAQGISDRSQADTLAIRALSQFGEVPDLEGIDLKLAGPDFARIASQARPLAEAATSSGLSVVARMNKLRNDNVRAIKNALAARGALRSGELGHQMNEEQGRYQQAQYDSRQQLVDLLSNIEAGFAAGMRQRAAQQAGATQSAMGNVMQAFPQPLPQQPGMIGPNDQQTISAGNWDPMSGMGTVQPPKLKLRPGWTGNTYGIE